MNKKQLKFFRAIQENDINTIKFLINDTDVDPAENKNYAIRKASEYGFLDIVKILLKNKNIDPSVDNNLAIRKASMFGFLDIVKILANDKRVDPSDQNNNAIKEAITFGREDVVHFLLTIVKADDFFIGLAAEEGQLTLFNFFLNELNLDPCSHRFYALKKASRNGHYDIVKLLLQIEGMRTSDDDNQAIHNAFSYEFPDIVKLLLTHEDTDLLQDIMP